MDITHKLFIPVASKVLTLPFSTKFNNKNKTSCKYLKYLTPLPLEGIKVNFKNPLELYTSLKNDRKLELLGLLLMQKFGYIFFYWLQCKSSAHCFTWQVFVDFLPHVTRRSQSICQDRSGKIIMTQHAFYVLQKRGKHDLGIETSMEYMMQLKCANG